MDLGHVDWESEHHPPEWDTKWSDYKIDRIIFIFRPVISGGKLLLLSSCVGSQLGSQNIYPQSQISRSEPSWLPSSNRRVFWERECGGDCQVKEPQPGGLDLLYNFKETSTSGPRYLMCTTHWTQTCWCFLGIRDWGVKAIINQSSLYCRILTLLTGEQLIHELIHRKFKILVCFS